MTGIHLEIDTPRAFVPLLGPGLRYRGARGGRGSGKSHFFAEMLVEKCVAEPGTHAVCIREIQKSLAQSAKRTIEGKIQKLGVGHLFDVQKAEIKTPGGGLIIFQGMQNHTAESIKSLEGYDVAWVEEAQTLSETSLRILRPTMRKPGSEIWFSWNPRKPEDPVDDFLRGNSKKSKEAREKGKWSPPPAAICVEANWQHNPWFHETEMLADKDYDFRRDRDMYAHVWGGEYEKNSQARVFKNWKVEWFDAPKPGTILYGGADWGWVDPTVGIICYIEGRTLYVWREVWQTELDISRAPALFDRLDPEWSSELTKDPNWKSLARRVTFIGDSSRPDTIAAMQKHGFRVESSAKGAGSIEDGVAFIQSYDVVIHPDCVHVAQEFEHYSYKIDPHTDQVTNVLEDKRNHTIDSVRYAVENVRRAVTTQRRELLV